MNKQKILWKRIIALILLVCLMLTNIGILSLLTMPFFASYRNPAPTNGVMEWIADAVKLYTYKDSLLSTAGSRYGGRLWVDKSVVAYSKTNNFLTLNEFNGSVSVNFNADFLHIFSALASSLLVNKYPPTPVDLVLVIDVSSSMQSGDDSSSRISKVVQSADNLITELMQMNPYNRVGIVLIDDNAYTMVPLDHYEPANGYYDADKNPGGGFVDTNSYDNIPKPGDDDKWWDVYYDSDTKTLYPADYESPDPSWDKYRYETDTKTKCGTDSKYPMSYWSRRSISITTDLTGAGSKSMYVCSLGDTLTIGNYFLDEGKEGALNYTRYTSTSKNTHDAVHYNFLSVSGGWPDLSTGIAHTGYDGDAYYGGTEGRYDTGNHVFGSGRVISFKYKVSDDSDPMKDMHAEDYNNSKVNGYSKSEIPDIYKDHPAFEMEEREKTVILSQVTEGGTNIQGGYYLGLRMLADAKDTFVNYPEIEYEDAARVPVFVLLSDGETNSSSDYSTWWMPGTLGVDTQNTFATDSSAKANQSYPYIYTETSNWSSTQSTSSTLKAMKPLMTAAYWKKIADANYTTSIQFYTIGLGLDSAISRLCLDPSTYLIAGSGDVNVNNVWRLTQAYLGTPLAGDSAYNNDSPRYYYSNGTSRPNDYTFFHPTNLSEKMNSGAYGDSSDLKFGSGSKSNLDYDLANYFFRRYSVAVIEKYLPITVNDNTDPSYAIDKIFYGEANGYTTVGRRSGYPDTLRDAANPYMGKDSDKYTKEYFAQYDIESLDDLYFVDSYFEAGDENIAGIFQTILDMVRGMIFNPVSGSNSAGVADSITYMDPVGQYMEIKNGSVTVSGETFDLALLLFGAMHGMVQTAVYDFGFNDAYMSRKDTQGEQYGAFQSGWYTSDDPLEAEYLENQDEGSWKEGHFYYVDYATAVQFIPTLESVTDTNGDGIINAQDATDKQKNTIYRLYRFSESTEERNLWRMNPAYAGRVAGLKGPNDIEQGETADYNENFVMNAARQAEYNSGASTPSGVYRLSDIRVWVEDTGDWLDEGGSLIADTGYDQALYVNIPASALPLQVVEITLNQSGNATSYVTNLDDEYQSTPLRLFYAVGLSDDIMAEDGSGVDFTKLSPEYLSTHRNEDGSVYFLSNYYSQTEYDGYVTETGAQTRGDPVVTFSPAADNRYYIVQKPLPLYTTAYQWNGSSFVPVDGANWDGGDFIGIFDSPDDAESADTEYNKGDVILISSADISVPQNGTMSTVIDSDKYYFMVIDFYRPVEGAEYAADKVNFVISRKGEEFIASNFDGISLGDMLCWYDPENGKYVSTTTEARETEGNFVLAAKPGGLRTGDMAQSVNAKTDGDNKTRTAINYYLPTLGSGSGTGNNAMVNVYLGNNGKLIIKATTLLVTKTVLDSEGDPVSGTFAADHEFSYTVYIEGFTGNHDAVVVTRNPYNNLWQQRISTIDLLTSNQNLLQNSDNTLTVVDINGNRLTPDENGEYPTEAYYVYIPDNTAEGDTGSDHVRRVYSNAANEVDLEHSGTTVYEIAEDGHPLGSTDFWVNNAVLIPIADVTSEWNYSENDGYSGFGGNFAVASLTPASDDGMSSEVVLTSPYATRSAYLTVTLEFNENGIAEFKLKDGEGLLFSSIDLNVDYEVTEILTPEEVSHGWMLWNRSEELTTENKLSVKTAARHVRQDSFIDYDNKGKPTGVWSRDADGEHIWEKNTEGIYVSPSNSPLKMTADFSAYNYTVSGDTSSAEEAVHYTNTYVTDDLEITKLLTGKIADRDKDTKFPFTLSLTVPEEYQDEFKVFEYSVTDEEGNKVKGRLLPYGEYAEEEIKETDIIANGDGTWSFTLKSGETIDVYDLPAGTVYSITENAGDGYDTDVTDSDNKTEAKSYTGTIKITPEDYDAHSTVNYVLFENEKVTPGHVFVSLDGTKELTGANGIIPPDLSDGQFSFVIEPDKGNPVSDPLKVARTVYNDAEGKITFFKDLEYTEVGSYIYRVHEAVPDDPHYSRDERVYIVTVTVSEKYEGDIFTGELEYEIAYSVEGTAAAEIVFSNIYSNTGRLQVTKEVDYPTSEDRNVDFSFTVTFSSETAGFDYENGYPAYMDEEAYTVEWSKGENGELIGKFTLRHGETVLITEIPEGVEYTVEETVRGGYVLKNIKTTGTVEGSTAVGIITLGKTEETTFINTLAPTLPGTGGIGTTLFYTLGMTLLAGGAAFAFASGHKKHNMSK